MGHIERVVCGLAASVVLTLPAGCRKKLAAPTTEPPRVAAAAGPGVQVCWVESRRRLSFTASSLLVRHARGDVLIDAGNSLNFHEEIQVYRGRTKRWLALLPGSLVPKVPLDRTLRAAGVDPARLRWILPTHAHLDHLGGVLDLPPTPVLVADPEAAIIRAGDQRVTTLVVPAHARAVVPRLERLRFLDAPYEIFATHADLFGDGSVVVVPLPGHTPGSVGVFVRLADGRRVFHVGDAVNNRVQIEQRRGRTPAMRGTDYDREQAERVVVLLHTLAKQTDDILFLPAHERQAWETIFARPGQQCPGPVVEPGRPW